MSTSPRTCAQNFLPNLTHSLVNSRLTLLHLYVPFTFQRIGQRDNSYRLPAAKIPLRFAQCPCTQTAICTAAVNHPHHSNHVNHSSDKCQPALVRTLLPEHNPSIPRTRRDTLPPSANFFSESKKTHQFTRQFAPLRANLILTSRTDRIQSRASHEPVPRFDPLCASAPPAATTPAPFTQPPVEPGRQAAAARIQQLALPWYTSASPRESAVPVANQTKGSWTGLTTAPPNRRPRTPQGGQTSVLRLKRPHAHRAQIDYGRSPAICCHRSIRLAEPSRISVENLVSE